MSLSILKRILENAPNLYLLIAFRDNVNKEVDNLFLDLNIIHLTNFKKEDTRKYIDLYVPTKCNNNKTADIIYILTDGNQFLISDILNCTKRQEYLDNLEFDLTNNLIDSLKNKINILTKEEFYICEIVCLFEGDIDSLLLTYFDIKSSEYLDFLCKINILKKTCKNRYEFAHDIIYTLVHEKISNSRKEELHKQIVDVIISQDNFKDYWLVIAFMIKIDKNILKEKKDINIFHAIYKYGLELKHKGLCQFDHTTFEICDYLISDVENKNDLFFDFRLDYMDSVHIVEGRSKSKIIYESLLKEKDKDTTIKIKLRYLHCLANKADWENVLPLGKELIKDLGFNLNNKTIENNLS